MKKNLKTQLVQPYAVRLLRSIRSVLAPNGRSSNAPAMVLTLTPDAC